MSWRRDEVCDLKDEMDSQFSPSEYKIKAKVARVEKMSFCSKREEK